MVKDAADWPVDYEAEAGAGNAFQRGIIHAFSALLSDEAVEAGATVMAESEDTGSLDSMRAALQAAVNAVTEGDTE